MLEPSLPRAAYTDDAVWEQERITLFGGSWVCVGRADSVGDTAGSYRLIDLQGESVLIVRGPDGALRAFANHCRHRGAELVDSPAPPDASQSATALPANSSRSTTALPASSSATGSGEPTSLPSKSTKLTGSTPPRDAGCFGAVIRCPYHHWTYALDGTLRATPHLDPATTGVDGLLTFDLDTWGGFAFVRQHTRGGPTLAEELGDVPRQLANYPLADLVVGASITYDVAANWKVLAENYNECYHCGPVHPELCDLVPSFRRGGGDDLDWERGIPHRQGAYTFTTTGTTSRRPFPGLSADELVNHKGQLVYPNLFVSLSCDHVAAFILWPRGPASTTVVCDFLFHPTEVARGDFDPSDAVEFWDLVNRQDWSICERVQRGMSSRHFEHGWYAPMEDPSLDIRRWWHARMEER